KAPRHAGAHGARASRRSQLRDPRRRKDPSRRCDRPRARRSGRRHRKSRRREALMDLEAARTLVLETFQLSPAALSENFTADDDGYFVFWHHEKRFGRGALIVDPWERIHEVGSFGDVDVFIEMVAELGEAFTATDFHAYLRANGARISAAATARRIRRDEKLR